MLDCGWYATLVGEEHTFGKELSWIDCVVPWHRSPAAVDKDLAISQELKVGRFSSSNFALVSGKSGDFPLWKAVGGECDEALPTPMPLYTLGQMPCHRRLFPQGAFWYGDLGKIHAQ